MGTAVVAHGDAPPVLDLIKPKDLAKLKQVGKKLSGAIIVISVLRDHFIVNEKKILKKFVQWGRRLDYRGFSRDGHSTDLIIKIKNTSDQVIIKGQFDVANTWVFGLVWFNRIEQFKFADGTTLSWSDVLAKVTTGGVGRDRLLGSYSPDTLDGKAGSDYLSGGNDGDTYLFGRGYGYDTIDDAAYNILTQNPDTVRFGAGITAAGLKFMRMPGTDNLMIEIAGTSDRLEILRQFSQAETIIFGSIAFSRIENFVFADGSSLDWQQVQSRMLIDSGTSGNNTLTGFVQDDRIDGGGGNDTLYGLDGADTYASEFSQVSLVRRVMAEQLGFGIVIGLNLPKSRKSLN